MKKRSSKNHPGHIPDMPLAIFLFKDPRAAWIWLPLRAWVGYEWIVAGWAKLTNPIWIGDMSGTAVTGFLHGAIAKSAGEHPDVTGWYAWFIQTVALPHAKIFSYLVAYGEMAVGVALLLGLFTGVAAFFGVFMNFNYLFAGTVSTNPILLLIQVFLILAWRVAGWIGLDRYALPWLSALWAKPAPQK